MWNPLSGSPGSLIRYNLLSCLPPLADLTRQSTLPSRRRLLLPSFRPSRLPFSPSDISTVASGHLHRQDSHLLEQQLASLHERGGFELPSPLISGWFRELVGIWILRRRNRLDEKDSVRVGLIQIQPDKANQYTFYQHFEAAAQLVVFP